jgi:hypothetical protein
MVDREDVHEAVEQLPASEDEFIDAQTTAKLDNAVAEGSDAVPLRKSSGDSACNAKSSVPSTSDPRLWRA